MTATRQTTRNTQLLTPAERMERFCRLQHSAMELLKASPEGYRRFLERNFRARVTHGSRPT